MRKSKAPEKIFIESNEDLIKVLKSDISVDTARRIAMKYLNVVDFSVGTPDVDAKELFIEKIELYLKRFAHLPVSERPLFLDQKTTVFDITDLYNHDN